MNSSYFQLSLSALLLFVASHFTVAFGQSSKGVELDPSHHIVIVKGSKACSECSVVSFAIKRAGYPDYLVTGNRIPLSYLVENRAAAISSTSDTVYVYKVVYLKKLKNGKEKRQVVDGDFGYFVLPK